MENFDYFKKDLNIDELDFVEQGKKYWKDKILRGVGTKRVSKKELHFLIDCIIENSFSNAKDFFNAKKNNDEKAN